MKFRSFILSTALMVVQSGPLFAMLDDADLKATTAATPATEQALREATDQLASLGDITPATKSEPPILLK